VETLRKDHSDAMSVSQEVRNLYQA